MNGTTDFDRTNYFQTVPSTALDLALWMESDRMGHLLGAIDQSKLDEQRGVVQNEKRQSENQPYGKVFEHIVTNVFPSGHPYSWLPIGSMEDLNAASLEDVRGWFETYYGPNNATLVLAGDVVTEDVRSRVAHYFGDIPPGPPLARKERWIPPQQGERRVVLEDRVPQARVYKAWRAPEWGHEDAVSIELLDALLTGGKTSRLYQRLVYESQIATDVGSFPFLGEIAGTYVVWATAQPGQDLVEIERTLEEEIERLLREGPTREELARVKTERVAGFVRGIEQVGGFSGKSNILAESAVFGGRPDAFKDALAAAEAATGPGVRDAGRRWLSAAPLTLEVRPYPSNLKAGTLGAERATLPMPTTFPDAPFPDLQQAMLANGMRLIVAERRAVPVVQFSLQMNAGYASDETARPGTANLAMEMLDEGTAALDALEISEALAQIGAELRTGSNLDFSFVSLSALTQNLEESLQIYADVILNPAFPQQELERLKRLQISQIQQEKSSPMPLALRVLPKLLYGDDHAYSLPMTGSGTESSVEQITRQELVDFHDTWFKANNATMIVVGDTTLEDIQPRLEALFAAWQPGAIPEKHVRDVPPAERQRVFLIDRPGSEQSIVIAGQIVPPKRDAAEIALQTANDILGGNFTSRINMNLREDKGWSYGTRSTIIDTMGQRPLVAYAPVQADRTAASMLEMAREITDFLEARPATAEEVATAKKRSTLTLPGRWETARAVASDIAELVRFGLPDDYWDRYAELVSALDVDAVQAAAGRVLEPSRLTWVVVGDRRRIEDEIEALGIGPITIVDVDGNIVVQN
jgi:zinc protease